jgi:ADP-ribose pyrophosphatase YjhB (NUDIX family)
LQQFFVFGDPRRVDQDYKKLLFEATDLEPKEKERLTQRHLTVGFYALVSYEDVKPIPDVISDACTWHSFDLFPELILDHKQILLKGMESLRLQLNYQPIGFNLLPEKFTMTELQTLYEVILNRKLDRRNFQRRVLAFGILNRLDEIKKGVAHKAPYLYSFNKEKYQNALKEGLEGGW